MAITWISLNPYLLNITDKECWGAVSRMRINLSMWLNLMFVLALCILLSGCLGNGDNELHVAQGTHLNADMGRYFVELNMTDNNEYSIGDVKTDEGSVKIGPPDSFMNSNYTSYSRDIMDKNSGKRKISMEIDHYNENIMTSTSNLLQLGLSIWPWDESAKYASHYLRNYDWITTNGALKDEIDAACWIDDHTILSLKMFDFNQSDSLAVLGSITARPVQS